MAGAVGEGLLKRVGGLVGNWESNSRSDCCTLGGGEEAGLLRIAQGCLRCPGLCMALCVRYQQWDWMSTGRRHSWYETQG